MAGNKPGSEETHLNEPENVDSNPQQGRTGTTNVNGMENGDNKDAENNSGNNSKTNKDKTYFEIWKEFVKGDIFDTKKYTKMQEVVEEILDEAKDGEDFDIFQMCAFYYDKEKHKAYYVMSLIKAVLCLSSQLSMLVYILHELLITHERGFCNLDTELSNKLVSVALAFFAGFYFAEEFDNVDNGGMYSIDLRDFTKCPAFINPIWLSIGKYYNLLLALAAWVGSYIVIFVSYDIFDLVLNSLALFWVIELDDLLTRTHDYTKVKKYIKRGINDPPIERNKCCNMFKYIELKHAGDGCCVKSLERNKCCNMLKARKLVHEEHGLSAKPNHKSNGCNCCVKGLECIVVGLRFGVFFFKFVIPILIGICT